MSFDLTGKVALVTGCRRGIGLAMTEALAAAGADIVGTSLNIDSAGSEAQTRVEGHGRTFAAYRADLGSEDGAAHLAASVLGDGLEVDILVNNAGTIARAPALVHDDEQWRRVLQTNLTSQFVLARELARPMVERGAGKIIFTASMLSFQGGVNVVSYTASKSGVAGLVRALANEWAPHGVNVNAIAPGVFRDRQHAAAAGRSGAVTCDYRADPRRPVGRPGRPGGCDRVPRLGRLRLRARGRAPRRRRLARAMTDVLAVVAEQRVLPVVTVESRESAGQLGQALAGAGARAVEITLRSEAAADAIEALAGEGFVVGAGTVRSVEQVDVAIAAGASFVVSPGLDRAVVERCAAPACRPCRVSRPRRSWPRRFARGVDSEALPGGGTRRHRPDPGSRARRFPRRGSSPQAGSTPGTRATISRCLRSSRSGGAGWSRRRCWRQGTGRRSSG